jgi:hypothetical protein
MSSFLLFALFTILALTMCVCFGTVVEQLSEGNIEDWAAGILLVLFSYLAVLFVRIAIYFF